MSRVAFKQCDLERVMRAAQNVGVAIAIRIERLTGDLLIGPVDAAPAEADDQDPGAYWDTFNAAGH